MRKNLNIILSTREKSNCSQPLAKNVFHYTISQHNKYVLVWEGFGRGVPPVLTVERERERCVNIIPPIVSISQCRNWVRVHTIDSRMLSTTVAIARVRLSAS